MPRRSEGNTYDSHLDRCTNDSTKHSKKNLKDNIDLCATLASSAVIGACSSPFVAILNGRTMKWNWPTTLKRFSARQALAITIQESAFVAGLSISDRLEVLMKQNLADNKAVEAISAFTAGALIGHPANTALTRWQQGLKMDRARYWMLGASQRIRAIGILSVIYNLVTKTLLSI